MPLLSDAGLHVGSSAVDRAYVGATQVWPSGAIPTFASVAPKSGASSTPITITGTNLGSVTGVTIGGVAATSFAVVNSTTITCTTPTHADGATHLVMTTATGHVFATGAFFYGTPDVTVDSLSVTTGDNAGGTTVTVTGTGFIGTAGSDATALTFAGQDASITSISSTSITCTTPANPVGFVDVVVARVDSGVGTFFGGLPNAFSYTSSPTATPAFLSINPTSGPTVGGEQVRMAGANLQSVTGVTFGGVAATSVTVLSSIAITCVAPAHAAATSDVAVTTVGGTATITGAYEYSAYTPVASGAALTLAATGPTAWHDRTLGRLLTTGDLVTQGGTHFVSDFIGQPWMTVGTAHTPTLVYGVHFTGAVRPDMDGVIFRACVFDNEVVNAAGGLRHKNTVFDFCTIDTLSTGVGDYSLGEVAWSAHRTSGRGGADGLRINGGDTVQDITECWVQVKMATWEDHNDPCQNFGGSGRIFLSRVHLDAFPEGGFISGPGIGGPNSCILSADLSLWTVLHLEMADSYLDGWTAVATARPYDGGLTEKITYSLTGNRFASRSSLPVHRGTTNTTPLAQIVWSGNVWDDDGSAIAIT